MKASQPSSQKGSVPIGIEALFPTTIRPHGSNPPFHPTAFPLSFPKNRRLDGLRRLGGDNLRRTRRHMPRGQKGPDGPLRLDQGNQPKRPATLRADDFVAEGPSQQLMPGEWPGMRNWAAMRESSACGARPMLRVPSDQGRLNSTVTAPSCTRCKRSLANGPWPTGAAGCTGTASGDWSAAQAQNADFHDRQSNIIL